MRRAASWVAAGLFLLLLGAPRAQAVEVNVLIQGFEYRPSTVEIDAGDVVAWTNVDATVHTVTADDGSFDSGRMGEGQRYAIAFSQPGTYAYHCELHDHAGTVTVRGGPPPPSESTTTVAPTTSTTAEAPATTTTTPPSAPGTSAATTTPPTTTVVVAADTSPTEPTTTIAPAVPSDGNAFAVVSAPLAAAPDPLGAPVVVAILVLAAVVAWQLGLAAPHVAALRLRWLAAALSAVTGAIHLQLRVELDYPQPTASLFLIQAGAAVALASVLVLSSGRIAVWLGVAFHVASLAAFSLSRTMGLFGFHETGFDPSPQAAVAVATEGAALGVLVVLALDIVRRSVASRPA